MGGLGVVGGGRGGGVPAGKGRWPGTFFFPRGSRIYARVLA